QPTADPGLAIALGGAGITLADLLRLYAALSNGGDVAPLRYRPDDPKGPGMPIFGPLGAWYVNDILAEAPPPPGVLPAARSRGRRTASRGLAGRGPPRPEARLQDRYLLWLSRFLGDRV